MSKLSAREWIETNEVANLDLPDSVHEMDVEGKVKELCIAFGESYATARLEAYKAELEEWARNRKITDKCNALGWKDANDRQSHYYYGKSVAFDEVIYHLTKKETDESK